MTVYLATKQKDKDEFFIFLISRINALERFSNTASFSYFSHVAQLTQQRDPEILKTSEF